MSLFRGASWLRIFYHDVVLGGDFKNESEARHVISQYKYSILDEIEQLGDLAKFQGKFEFLLDYPQYRPDCNWWRQSNFITIEQDNITGKKYVEGYENVSISWTEYDWGGLGKAVMERDSNIQCYIDGSIGVNNWHYAIGKYGFQYPNSIPANGTTVRSVFLWMRIPKIHQLTRYSKFYIHSSYLYLFIFSLSP